MGPFCVQTRAFLEDFFLLVRIGIFLPIFKLGYHSFDLIHCKITEKDNWWVLNISGELYFPFYDVRFLVVIQRTVEELSLRYLKFTSISYYNNGVFLSKCFEFRVNVLMISVWVYTQLAQIWGLVPTTIFLRPSFIFSNMYCWARFLQLLIDLFVLNFDFLLVERHPFFLGNSILSFKVLFL